MKTFKTIASIFFIALTIAIIVFDATTSDRKKAKIDSLKRDSASHASIKK